MILLRPTSSPKVSSYAQRFVRRSPPVAARHQSHEFCHHEGKTCNFKKDPGPSNSSDFSWGCPYSHSCSLRDDVFGFSGTLGSPDDQNRWSDCTVSEKRKREPKDDELPLTEEFILSPLVPRTLPMFHFSSSAGPHFPYLLEGVALLRIIRPQEIEERAVKSFYFSISKPS